MTEPLDLTAIEKLSAERNAVGAYCTMPHRTVVGLILEIEDLREEIARRDEADRDRDLDAKFEAF